MPVKFIVGDLDITYHIPGAQEYIHKGGFRRDVPFLQEVVVMEGAAHFINQEKPEEISAHIYDFIKKFWFSFSHASMLNSNMYWYAADAKSLDLLLGVVAPSLIL